MRLLRSLVLLLAAAPLAAQARLLRDTEVRSTPDGNVIATLQVGTSWSTGAARGGFTAVTVDGWVDASRFAGRRESFSESIGGSGTLRIRAEPSLNGRIMGVFAAGAGIRVLERRGTWARVQRDGFVLSVALGATTAARVVTSTARVAAPDPVVGNEPSSLPRSGSLRAIVALPLRNAPGAATLGTLEGGTVVEPLARDRGWVRIRIEAWVPDSLLAPTDTSYQAALTAADLRLDPEGLRGRTVRWSVQIVGLQTADPLRRSLAPDEPYLLAMGPADENAILYLAVPPALLAQARALAPLANVVVTARIRTGRSEPTGAPVLDLLSIVKR